MTREEAIKAIKAWDFLNNDEKEVIETLIPELKESEDEKIRKELIDFVKSRLAGFPQCDKYVAWIEKQGEQKPFDYENANIQQKDFASIEPRFKVGDWVVVNNKHQSIYQVEKIEDGYYILRHTHGGTFRVCVLHDESLRFWNISDAKAGDVLASKDGEDILIFARLDSITSFSCYYSIRGKWNSGWYNNWFIPATKEQRDLIFSKMHESGYEWDEIKNKLKKIEQKFNIGDEIKIANEESLTITKIDEKGYWSEDLFICGFDDTAKLELVGQKIVGQKPVWSAEDDRMLHTIIADFNGFKHDNTSTLESHFNECIDWLKSLKERLPEKSIK